MPDHVDSILKFTREHPIFGGILDYLRRFSCVVSSAFGYSSELLVNSPGNYSLAAMASVDPIDISSTDSDSDLREIDNYRDESPVRDTASSINSRILPSWASSAHSNLTGHNGLSRKDPSSSKRQIVYDEMSSRPHKRLNTAETVGAASSGMDAIVKQKNGSSNPRGLENVGASEIRETYGKSYQPATWSSSSNGRNSMKEDFMWGGGNDSSLYERKGNRLLPPSLMPGKHSSATPFVGSNDTFHHTGVAEERPAGADERFVFQAAVQDLHQPKVEATLPDGLLSVSLLRHQKIALAWMLSKESSGLCLGGILADDQVDVMLMSLKAGNLGLNMVAACRVILLDLWWNPTTEDQAVDRAHRIGQTRPVTVSRLTIKDTVEDRILALQEEKRKMVASAFGEDQSGGHATRLTVEDLRFLFEGSEASGR
ncbi:UNVERIFIED_CONTAM: Helicase-like transcription factor CHR28 [Sesamum latifolium]|uniref:Helicase-like transcription factor CHR28 n=1 Tax=Sesamum latifolium TaxID=2727402 RepID=A0AAW2XFH5_9LAMI